MDSTTDPGHSYRNDPAYPRPIDEFCDEAAAEFLAFKRDPRWGGWTFHPKWLVLVNVELPWYEIDLQYDTATDQCEPFTYGGCFGNANRFSTKGECVLACGICIEPAADPGTVYVSIEDVGDPDDLYSIVVAINWAGDDAAFWEVHVETAADPAAWGAPDSLGVSNEAIKL